MSGGGPMFTYVPAPHERAYYGALFQAADVERSGSIGGAKAVEFFTRSKVHITVLKEIWTASDQPPTNALDPRKFAVAVRLIQLEQNGCKPAASDLAEGVPPNLRPVFFHGVPVPGVPPTTRPPVPVVPSGGSSAAGGGGGSVSGGSVVAGAGAASFSGSHQQQQQRHQQHHQLAVQDPYTLTPAEQSRYDQIFPEYCSKQDPNFMYGAEAVALFNKSGLPQPLLAQIWNMVDTPVDNRLDKLEFAMAMHLIVCISKKNLPMPAALPMSLKQLKSQQASATMNGGGGGGGSNTSVAAPMSPPRTIQQQQQQPMTMMNNSGQSMPPAPLSMNSNQSMGGGGGGASQAGFGIPPPMVANRGMPQQQPSPMAAAAAASFGGQNAFQQQQQQQQHPNAAFSMGVSASGGGLPGPPPLTQQQGGLSISDAFEGLGGAGDTGSISSYRASTPVPAAFGNPGSGFQMAAAQSFDQSAAYNGMPSPNQSPRAMMTMTTSQDPTPVHRSTAKPEAAFQPMTTTQLASSYDMGENNEELDKLRGALQKLQAENISLKAKMGTMTDEEHDIQKELNATVAEVTKLASGLTNVRAQVLASKSRLLEATAELKAAQQKKGVLKDLIDDATATKQAIDEAYESIENANEVVRVAPSLPPAPAVTDEADLFGGWGDDAPVHAPLPSASTNYSEGESTNASQPYNSSQPPAPSYAHNTQPPAPARDMYSGGGYTGDGHGSMTGGFGEVMGSGPALQQQGFASTDASSGAPTFDSLPHAPSMKEVEDLKSKSKEADDVAREAEASRRQLVAQLEELRRVADEAESKARAATEKPTKKKGILGRGGPTKRDAKEVQKLALDARDKKEALLQVQSQVKDAESLAEATKQEAERLNKEAEDAQMAAASAASVQDRSPPPAANGYANKAVAPPSYGMGPPVHATGLPSYEIASKPPTPGGGFGGPPIGGFDAHVMGSGVGISIPTPSEPEDPYVNPFQF